MSDQPMYDREGTARMIRTCYFEQQNRVAGKVGKKGYKNSRHDNMENWLKAADSCLEEKANPIDWVAAAFMYCRHTMFATAMNGPAAKAWYKEYQRSRTGNAERAARAEQRLVENPQACPFVETVLGDFISDQIDLAVILMKQRRELDEHWDPMVTLNDPYTCIEPHIRVALAGRWGKLDIVKNWAQQAREFFSTHPAHFETLRLMGFDVKQYLDASTQS